MAKSVFKKINLKNIKMKKNIEKSIKLNFAGSNHENCHKFSFKMFFCSSFLLLLQFRFENV